MKSKKISKKAIALSCVLLAVIICIVVILGSTSKIAEKNHEGSISPTASNNDQATSSQSLPDTNSNSENNAPSVMGSTETFSYGNLILEISNVKDKRTESKLDDGLAQYEQTIFTCYPGATLSVINADMSDPTYTADGKPHAQWGLYDIQTDERTDITDKSKPVALDKNMGVVNLESSLLLLVFDFVE